MRHRVHVLKIPTTRANEDFELNLFPYTHYSDQGHDPRLEVSDDRGDIVLRCADSFKLHPNYMKKPANRADIYLPGAAAAAIAIDIIELAGPGDVAELAEVDPEAARSGPQTLPYIRETRQVVCEGFAASIAGCTITGGRTTLFIDNEAPREGHVEMMGPEVHLGVMLDEVHGRLDKGLVRNLDLWRSPTQREGAEAGGHSMFRPAPTTNGIVELRLARPAASRLAACLLHYARAHELEQLPTS